MATTVKLLKHQGLILQSPYVYDKIRYHFLVAGYAAGKTSALVYCLLYAVKLLQGKKDEEGHNPRIILGSKNLTFMMKTSVSNLEQTLMLTKTPYHFDKKNNIFTIGNVEIYLIPLENPENIYGWSVSCCFCDELSELSPEVCMEAIKSLNDRIRQQIKGFRTPFFLSVSSAQGLDGQYLALEHFKRNGMGYVLIRGETKDNIFLPKSYVENLYKIYNEKERAVYLEGHFMSVKSSLVFTDYDPVKNKLDEDLYDCLADDDTVYVGQDFNSFFCAGVAVVVKKGAVVIIKDYKFPEPRKIPEILRYDFPTQKIVWIPDATASAIYTQFKKELRRCNIKIAYRKSNPLVQDRVFAINKLLYAERMFICPICKDMEHSFLTHQYDPKTGAPMKGGINAPDHHSDSLGYAVYYCLGWLREFKDVYDVTLGRRKMQRLGSFGTEVDADYSLMRPENIKTVMPVNAETVKDSKEKDGE